MTATGRFSSRFRCREIEVRSADAADFFVFSAASAFGARLRVKAWTSPSVAIALCQVQRRPTVSSSS